MQNGLRLYFWQHWVVEVHRFLMKLVTRVIQRTEGLTSASENHFVFTASF